DLGRAHVELDHACHADGLACVQMLGWCGELRAVLDPNENSETRVGVGGADVEERRLAVAFGCELRVHDRTLDGLGLPTVRCGGVPRDVSRARIGWRRCWWWRRRRSWWKRRWRRRGSNCWLRWRRGARRGALVVTAPTTARQQERRSRQERQYGL